LVVDCSKNDLGALLNLFRFWFCRFEISAQWKCCWPRTPKRSTCFVWKLVRWWRHSYFNHRVLPVFSIIVLNFDVDMNFLVQVFQQ